MAVSDIENTFTSVRAKAAAGQIVIVRPDGRFLLLRPPSKHTAPPQIVAAVERMIPPTSKRNVAVIGDTSWALDEKSTLQTANQAIPFFGLLMGSAAIGHAVWVFGGASVALNAGCREADVLIVDDACLPMLPSEWQSNAAKVMRDPEILIHDRAKYQLRKP
jgi:hypothetical protein